MAQKPRYRKLKKGQLNRRWWQHVKFWSNFQEEKSATKWVQPPTKVERQLKNGTKREVQLYEYDLD